MIESYKLTLKLAGTKLSRKRGSGLDPDLRNYINRITKLEESGYRFSESVIDTAFRFYTELRGKQLTQESKAELRSWTPGKLKSVAIKKVTAKKPYEEVDYEEYGYNPSENLPNEDDIMLAQIEAYKKDLNADVAEIYDEILKYMTPQELKALIKSGGLPMWEADSEAVLTLRTHVLSYPEHIQNMILQVYETYSHDNYFNMGGIFA